MKESTRLVTELVKEAFETFPEESRRYGAELERKLNLLACNSIDRFKIYGHEFDKARNRHVLNENHVFNMALDGFEELFGSKPENIAKLNMPNDKYEFIALLIQNSYQFIVVFPRKSGGAEKHNFSHPNHFNDEYQEQLFEGVQRRGHPAGPTARQPK